MAMDEITKGVSELFYDDDPKGVERAHPYSNLEKAKVLQDARIFHDDHQVREDPQKCCVVLVQLLALMQNTNQALHGEEATEIFFGVTKLFVSHDLFLRRMTYLFIKEIYERCESSDVIIVTSCLTKDMTCDVDLYRANSLRVLCRIIDASMLSAVERYFKAAIVDNSSLVSSSALVSASHLYTFSPEFASIVKRWIGETQEALKSRDAMVQFHAICLLYQIKSHDRLGISKLIQQFGTPEGGGGRGLKSPLAVCCLIRYTAKLLHDEVRQGRGGDAGVSYKDGSSIMRGGFVFLESCLKHRDEMIGYEAARAICHLPRVEAQDLHPAIAALQLFMSSPKPTLRYASIRTIAAVANHHPRSVSVCNQDLEALVADRNRSIATLAITTLLKTGSEHSLERLLGHISVFMSDLSDEFKITVIKSMQRLCVTYPSLHNRVVGFLSNTLREEGGYDFKKSLVGTIVSLMKGSPETADQTLFHLCEFIEDCEYTSLSTHILDLLGEMGPGTREPARYIRFIYNRVILENAIIRSAAISSLTKFAAACPSLRPSILTLLHPSLLDEDDEARDRASISVRLLEEVIQQRPYSQPEEEDAAVKDEPTADDEMACAVLRDMPMSFDKLQRSMKAFITDPGTMESIGVLTFASLPIIEDDQGDNGGEDDDLDADLGVHVVEDAISPLKKKSAADAIHILQEIPELASLGRVFRSTRPVALTESETEYVVECVKHIFEEHIVLQFIVQNTLDDQRLDNVTVSVESDSDFYEVTGEIAADQIKYGEIGNCFAVLERKMTESLASCQFSCEMKFAITQIDPATGEEEGEPYEEEYPLEDLEVTTSDYMARVAVPDFRASWETMGNTHEVMDKYLLHVKTLKEAVASVVDSLGMQPCEGTGSVKSEGKPHMLHLSGVFVGGKSALVRSQLSLQSGEGVVVKIAVRSEREGLSQMLAGSIS
mmetsp:Transcript_29994/g.87622  ORF Transcript_29994/g.87622 Transcript_29994/m.87622 type:complete len:946 (-) Transcript_29994:90-2927(-)